MKRFTAVLLVLAGLIMGQGNPRHLYISVGVNYTGAGELEEQGNTPNTQEEPRGEVGLDPFFYDTLIITIMQKMIQDWDRILEQEKWIEVFESCLKLQNELPPDMAYKCKAMIDGIKEFEKKE